MGFDGKADRIRFPAVQADGRFSSGNVSRSMGNYSGYSAFWEVRDGYLCLQRVEADVYDEVSKKEYTRMYEVKDLRPILRPIVGLEKFKPAGSVGNFGPEKEIW